LLKFSIFLSCRIGWSTPGEWARPPPPPEIKREVETQRERANKKERASDRKRENERKARRAAAVTLVRSRPEPISADSYRMEYARRVGAPAAVACSNA
jgi:hypothetical protein